ncbi:MAG TPA: heavy-metal-associated domain-containing protein [Magnetovibrio sp.]
MSETYTVLGMTCGGCAKSVTNAILDVAPGAEVSVDLQTKAVTVQGATEDTVKQAVKDAGFEFVGKA